MRNTTVDLTKTEVKTGLKYKPNQQGGELWVERSGETQVKQMSMGYKRAGKEKNTGNRAEPTCNQLQWANARHRRRDYGMERHVVWLMRMSEFIDGKLNAQRCPDEILRHIVPLIHCHHLMSHRLHILDPKAHLCSNHVV